MVIFVQRRSLGQACSTRPRAGFDDQRILRWNWSRFLRNCWWKTFPRSDDYGKSSLKVVYRLTISTRTDLFETVEKTFSLSNEYERSLLNWFFENSQWVFVPKKTWFTCRMLAEQLIIKSEFDREIFIDGWQATMKETRSNARSFKPNRTMDIWWNQRTTSILISLLFTWRVDDFKILDHSSKVDTADLFSSDIFPMIPFCFILYNSCPSVPNWPIDCIHGRRAHWQWIL